MARKKKTQKTHAADTSAHDEEWLDKNGVDLETAQANGAKVVADMVAMGDSRPTERRRYPENLPVRVDNSILLRAGEDLANCSAELERLKSERRDVMAKLKERRTGIEERMAQYADTIRNGTESRPVEVIEYLMPDNEIRVVRTDTGEIVRTRQPEVSDLQETLPLSKSKEAVERFTRGEGTIAEMNAAILGDGASKCTEELAIVDADGHRSGFAPCTLVGAHDVHQANFTNTTGDDRSVSFIVGDKYDVDGDRILALADEALVPHEVDATDDVFADLAGEHLSGEA